MTHGSLFSGIGGFDLAAQWCGWTNVFQCEIEPFCLRVLKYFFPKTTLYENIKETDFTAQRGAVDVLSGGPPCQPASVAGKRKGKDDDRWLWEEAIRVLCEVRPTWAVFENPYGILSVGERIREFEVESPQNWAAEDFYDTLLEESLLVEQIQQSIKSAGYSVVPVVIPACAVGAPHRRDRVWFVAHRADAAENALGNGCAKRAPEQIGATFLQQRNTGAGNSVGLCVPEGITPDPGSEQFQKRTQNAISTNRPETQAGLDDRIKRPCNINDASDAASRRRIQDDESVASGQPEQNIPNWRNFPTQSPVRRK
jgi:DNA (cytosine-5)-methyltransferase 1